MGCNLHITFKRGMGGSNLVAVCNTTYTEIVKGSVSLNFLLRPLETMLKLWNKVTLKNLTLSLSFWGVGCSVEVFAFTLKLFLPSEE